MEQTQKERLWQEAKVLIDQAAYSIEEKNNLSANVLQFLSMVKNEQILKDTSWSYFDYRKEDNDPEGGRGLDLLWDWPDVHGVFGFYTDNGHGFSHYATRPFCKPCKMRFCLPIAKIKVVLQIIMCKGDMLENIESRFVRCSATSQRLRLAE